MQMREIQRSIEELQERIKIAETESYRNNVPEYYEALKTAITALQNQLHYEQLRQQGRLIELPCALGTPIYYNFGSGLESKYWHINKTFYEIKDVNRRLGVDFWLTKEEAEKALKEAQHG